jgi:glutamyl-tRNA synthetase
MLRFSPSPTRDICLQDIRIALLNYLVAQQTNDTLLLRIADTNKEKVIEGKDTEIVQILEKFAIKDDLRYHQSEHLNLHQTLAIQLLENHKAFLCKCVDKEKCEQDCQNLTEDELKIFKDKKEPFVIRIIGDKDIDSFIILHTDSTPSYDFACACDDIFDDINYVIEDIKHLHHSTKQIYIKSKLGYDKECIYTHIADIEDTISLQTLFEEGFIPDAIINYLLSIGYDDVPYEIFTLPDAIKWYDINKISQENIKFDIDKLKKINQKHLMALDDKELSKVFGFADADIGKVAKIYLENTQTIKELEDKIKPIFTPKDFECECKDDMLTIQKVLFDAPLLDTLDELEEYIIKHTNLTKENIKEPLNRLITNSSKEVELQKIYPLIKFYLLEVIS